MRKILCICRPSFLNRAKIGIKKVLRHYPKAQLLEVQGFPVKGGFINNPQDIDEMAIVFSNMEVLPDGTEHIETLTIRSTGPRKFGEIEVVQEPWLGVVPIRFNDIRMSLAEAIKLKKKAGHTRPEDGVFVCKTLSFVNKDILYIFGRRSPFHLVNTRTKEVFEEIIDFNRP